MKNETKNLEVDIKTHVPIVDQPIRKQTESVRDVEIIEDFIEEEITCEVINESKQEQEQVNNYNNINYDYLERAEKEKPKETGETCPNCGSMLVIRKGKRGEFTACSNYKK